MTKLFDIFVNISSTICVEGATQDICMITFIGEAKGRYFNGKLIGTGIDTQFISKDKHTRLSARYMLEGKDIDGNSCRCFIENNGSFEDGFIPKIVTDSPALSEFESAELKAEILIGENAVTVSVFA